MKKSTIITLAISIAPVLFSSCQRFDEGISPQDNGDSFTIRLTCPEDDTKTALNGTKPVWKAEDAIWISDGKNYCKSVVDIADDGKPTAELKVSGLGGGTYYALYPFNENAYVKDGQICVDIPSVQSGEFADAGICVGTCTSTDLRLFLHSVCPVLHFSSNDESMVSMQFNNLTGIISGEMMVDAATGTCASFNRQCSSLKMDFKGRHNEFYLAATPTVFEDEGRIVFTTSEHYIGTITMTTSNTLEKGIIYEMGNLNEHITMSKEPATDLSSRESANCYIVSKGKPYRLCAVKGNSSEAIQNVAYADVVWETTNNGSVPKRFSLINDLIFSEGYVYFNIPETAPDGNALIAARNASGEILWSWHIWILESGVEFYTLKDGCYIMDRNLGALTSEPGSSRALGFLYQWGRKDPFPSASTTSGTTLARLCGTAITKHDCTETTGTIEYSVKNPTDIIYNSEGGSWLNDDMLLWSSTSKTMFDPCPPGYRIPAKAMLSACSSGTWDSGTRSLTAVVNGKNVYFPAAGYTYYNSGSLKSTGTYGYYWYDCTSGSSPENICRIASNGMNFYSQGSNHYAPQAFSVRCQKISASDDYQLLKITYSVTRTDYDYRSLWYSEKRNSSNQYSWGDGTVVTLKDSVSVHHIYGTAGDYSVTLKGYDIDFVKLRSLGDVTEIDLSNF